jgi:heme/copper-type cytochrome/quinol oxidase subunit 4
LLTLDLVFLLIFLSRRYNLKVDPKNWAAVIGVVIGLTFFFLCTRPSGGTIKYKFLSWAVTLGVIAIIIGGTILIVPKLKNARERVALLALATACTFGLNAGLLKLCLNQLKGGGAHLLLLSWPLYVLLFTAALSLYLTQNTLSSGSLVISQPIIEIVQPAVSIMIGFFIFDEDLKSSTLAIIGDILSTILLLVCIWILARSDGVFIQNTKHKRDKNIGSGGLKLAQKEA